MFHITELFNNLETFVSWPNQVINRNESELVIFSKYFDIIDKEAVRKQMLQIPNDEEIRNVDTANEKRTMGNKLYKDKKYDLAVQYYTESILYVPRDSNEFALALANRSAAFFDMEKYKECLQDISTTIKSKYPEELKYKIYIRLSKCCLKLHLYFEAAKSIMKAQEYLDTLNLSETQASGITEVIAEVKNQLKHQLGINVTDVPDRNVDEANKERSVGNTFYKDKNYDLAVQHYTQSLLYSPRDTKEFGLAVANRSAAYFDMEKYEECLQDIDLAMKSFYPDDLKYKILLRQSKCYSKLNLNLKAANSIRKCEEYVENFKLSETQITVVKEAILEIKSNLKDQQGTNEIDELDNNFMDDLNLIEPRLKNGQHPKFLSAAQVVDYKYNKVLGRHVVANTDILKGDVLFIEEPYSYVALEQPSDACAFCLQITPYGIPCTECPWYMYCSDECRLSAWKLGHQWECVGVRRKIISNKLQKLALYTLFKASYDGFQTTIEDYSIYGQKNNYPYVDKLVTNKNKISTDLLQQLTKEAVWMVLYLKNYTNFFTWLHVKSNRQEDLYKYIGGQLLKYCLQIECNAVHILQTSVHFDPKMFGYTRHMPIGFGIYVSTALLNHSCLPNAMQIFDGTRIIIKSRDFIKKGTEITINYLVKTFYNMKGTEERQALLKKYEFTCTCPGCTDPTKSEIFNVLLCPICNGRARRAFKTDPVTECIDCHKLTVSSAHFSMLAKILKLIVRCEVHEDYSVLDELQNLLEKTVHKQNVTYYFSYYNLRLLQYNKAGDFKKCVKIAKLSMKQFEPSMGDIYSINFLLTYTFFLIKYCFSVKTENSGAYKYDLVTRNEIVFMNCNIYRKNMNLTKKMLQKSAMLLQYYTSINNIEQYVSDMIKYFNTGYIKMKSAD